MGCQVLIFLTALLVLAIGAAAWFYMSSRAQAEAAAHQRGSGAASILRGVLAAYTGGLSTGITAAARGSTSQQTKTNNAIGSIGSLFSAPSVVSSLSS